MTDNRVPAFPQTDPSKVSGMTLSEWYAGMAMQALLSHQFSLEEHELAEHWQLIADRSFNMANAMMAKVSEHLK